MHIRIKRTHPAARLPAYATEGAACFDLYAATVNAFPHREKTAPVAIRAQRADQWGAKNPAIRPGKVAHTGSSIGARRGLQLQQLRPHRIVGSLAVPDGSS